MQADRAAKIQRFPRFSRHAHARRRRAEVVPRASELDAVRKVARLLRRKIVLLVAVVGVLVLELVDRVALGRVVPHELDRGARGHRLDAAVEAELPVDRDDLAGFLCEAPARRGRRVEAPARGGRARRGDVAGAAGRPTIVVRAVAVGAGADDGASVDEAACPRAGLLLVAVLVPVVVVDAGLPAPPARGAAALERVDLVRVFDVAALGRELLDPPAMLVLVVLLVKPEVRVARRLLVALVPRAACRGGPGGLEAEVREVVAGRGVDADARTALVEDHDLEAFVLACDAIHLRVRERAVAARGARARRRRRVAEDVR
mmetsp:Transcript_1912/g.5671  ORF Transcript_1912/g.5671 Transcript_1912/m.5671 type:complete len:317 (+) Transcript_1912:848-1798(+)